MSFRALILPRLLRSLLPMVWPLAISRTLALDLARSTIRTLLPLTESIASILPKPAAQDDHILFTTTFRRKKTKVRQSRLKQKRKKLKRKSFKKQEKANV